LNRKIAQKIRAKKNKENSENWKNRENGELEERRTGEQGKLEEQN